MDRGIVIAARKAKQRAKKREAAKEQRKRDAAADGGSKAPRAERRLKVIRGKVLRPGAAAAKRGKHCNRMSFDERLEAAARRNAEPDELPTFRILTPRPDATGAEVRELKAAKRKAAGIARTKGLVWSTKHIGTRCI